MKAPDFVLMEAMDHPVRLSEELRRGPVLLLFYPNDFGIVCTVEMRSIIDLLGRIQGKGVLVLGVSRNTTYTHRQFKESQGIPFPLLADAGGEVSQLYAGLQDSGLLAGRPKRAVFLVDSSRTILYAWVSKVEGLLPPFEEMMTSIMDL